MAHFQYHQPQPSLSLFNFKLYEYFCEMLFIRIADISRANMMQITSYLNQKDLSQMIQLCKGTLNYIRENLIQGLNSPMLSQYDEILPTNHTFYA